MAGPVVVFVNCRVVEADRPESAATAIAVAGPSIVAVGADAVAMASDAGEVVDLRGATVTPGLVDAHLHPVLALDAVRGVELTHCADLGEVESALAVESGGRASDEWIVGWGLDPNVFDDDAVTAAVVDRAVGARPALVHLFDGHSALASAEALRRAGVTGARAFTSSAAVDVDPAGAPTGLLLEPDAVDLVRSLVPVESYAQREQRLADVLAAMAATGLTGGHVMDCSGDTLQLLASLSDQDRLPLRLRVSPWCGPDDVDPGADLGDLLATQGRGGRSWTVAGIKLFLDGTIDNGTAWLHEPDCHGRSTASYWPDPAHFADVVTRLHRAGVPTATHAIGDAAVRFVLDTHAALVGQPGPRHRIEHIETLPDDQVGRFAALGVIASMQPTHATDFVRADHSDNWSRRLGPARADRAWRCADILRAGGVLALGSDWPVAPFDPRVIMAAARLRRPVRRPASTPVGPEQALTAREALAGYTTAPAWAEGAETSAGRISAGHRADLTVWAEDPLRVPAAELADLPVVATVMDGRIRHRAASL